MRGILYVILSLAAAAVAAAGFCALAGWQIHVRELFAAAVAAVIASAAGLMPTLLNRQSPVETVMQAALAGSVLQMMICLILGILIWVGGLAASPVALAAWLMLFYWVSLAAVATILVGYIRRAAPAPLHP